MSFSEEIIQPTETSTETVVEQLGKGVVSTSYSEEITQPIQSIQPTTSEDEFKFFPAISGSFPSRVEVCIISMYYIYIHYIFYIYVICI